MVRFSQIVLAYFVIGVVVFGGGGVVWENAGVPNFFVDQSDSGEFSGSEELDRQTNETGNAISSVVNTLTGPVLLVWKLAGSIFALIHWPVFALSTNNAPPILVLGLGGGFTAAFYLSIIRLVRSSA